MEVDHHLDLPLFLEFPHHPLDSVESWVELLENLSDQPWSDTYLVDLLPPSIQVGSRKRSPIVPVDDPIGVDHGYDLEDDVVSEVLGLLVMGDQEVDHALHHIRAHGLTRVLMGEDHYADSFLTALESIPTGDRDLVTFVVGDGVDEGGLSIVGVPLGVELD